MIDKCPNCGNKTQGKIKRSIVSKGTRTVLKKGGMKATLTGIGTVMGGPLGTVSGLVAGTAIDMIAGNHINKAVDGVTDTVLEDHEYEFECPNCGHTWTARDDEDSSEHDDDKYNELSFTINEVWEENGCTVVEGSLERGSIIDNYTIDVVKRNGERLPATVVEMATKELKVDSVSSFFKGLDGKGEYEYKYTSYMDLEDEDAFDFVLFLTGIDAEDISFGDRVEDQLSDCDDEEEEEDDDVDITVREPELYKHVLKLVSDIYGVSAIDVNTKLSEKKSPTIYQLISTLNSYFESKFQITIAERLNWMWEKRNEDWSKFSGQTIQDLIWETMICITDAPRYLKNLLDEDWFIETYIIPNCEGKNVTKESSMREARPVLGKIWSALTSDGIYISHEVKDHAKLIRDAYDDLSSWSFSINNSLNSQLKRPSSYPEVDECRQNVERLLNVIKGKTIANVPQNQSSDKMTAEEEEYLNEYKEIIANGEISERDSRYLDKIKKANNISDTRAKELETIASPSSISPEEQEYINEYKEIIAEGEISDRDRRFLEKIKKSNNISNDRAKELEAMASPSSITPEEQEYLDEYKEMIAGGEISDRDQRYLDKIKKANNISDDRAKELEAMA